MVLVLMALMVSSCTSDKKILEFHKTEMGYLEFVYEDTSCDSDCMREYIVMSNGAVLEKIEKEIGRENGTEIIIGSIDVNKADELIKAAEGITVNFSNNGLDCEGCRLYHLFYGSKKKTTSFTTLVSDAPEFMEKFEEKIKLVLESQESKEQFFIHFVFKKPQNNIVDYHFFSDGIVLKEEFGSKNGELALSEILMINKREIDDIKGLIKEGAYNSKDNIKNCLKKGIEWGYIEIKNEDKYGSIYTCGEGTSEADKLFLELIEKTGAG